MSDKRLLIYVLWRAWTFGVVLGPEVYGLYFGPLQIEWVVA